MKAYEAVFILNGKHADDNGDAIAAEISKHIQELGGQVKEEKSLGRRQFARPIGKHRAGVYWDFVFELKPADVAPFKGKYRLDERVLRVMVIDYVEPPKYQQQSLSDSE